MWDYVVAVPAPSAYVCSMDSYLVCLHRYRSSRTYLSSTLRYMTKPTNTNSMMAVSTCTHLTGVVANGCDLIRVHETLLMYYMGKMGVKKCPTIPTTTQSRTWLMKFRKHHGCIGLSSQSRSPPGKPLLHVHAPGCVPWPLARLAQEY